MPAGSERGQGAPHLILSGSSPHSPDSPAALGSWDPLCDPRWCFSFVACLLCEAHEIIRLNDPLYHFQSYLYFRK